MTNDRGAISVIVACAMLVLTALFSLVISTGFMVLATGESQNCADACALGVARAFYQTENFDEPEYCDINQQDVVDNLMISNDCELVAWSFGHWDGNDFVQGGSVNIPIESWPTTVNIWYTTYGFINAARVTARKYRPIIAPLTCNGNVERSAIAMVKYEEEEDGNVSIARGAWLVK